MSDNDMKVNLASFELARPYTKPIDYDTGLMTWNETVILDNNSSNKYPYGNVTWSSQTIGQLGADRLFVPSQAYVQIPIITKLVIDEGTFTAVAGGSVVPSNVCAIAKKSALAFVNRVTDTIGGTSIGLMTENRPYYQIMRSHEVNDEVAKQQYEEQLDHYFVKPHGRKWFKDTIGECDNQSVILPTAADSNYTLMQSFDNKNDVFVKQGRKFQYFGETKVVPVAGVAGFDVNPLKAFGNGDQNVALQLQKHYELPDDETIIWYDVLEIPLKHLSAIGHLPPCSTLNGLKLTLEMPHLANNITMKITYPGLAAGSATTLNASQEFVPSKFEYAAGTSQLYPYIHGQAGTDVTKGYPLVCCQKTKGTDFTITSSTSVGWGDKIQGACCRLVIPSVAIGSMMSKIVAQPQVKIDVLDATVDTQLFQKVSNGQVFTNALLQAPIAKPCRVWLLPYVHKDINGVATQLSPQMSPFSMAPCLTSPLNLLNLQLHISTQAVYPQPLNTKRDFYNLYNKVVNNLANGNSFHSHFRNGQMSFDEFCLSPIYCFDISQKYLDEQTHSDNKMIGFSFQADFGKQGAVANVGQIIVVVESYQSFMFDRTTSLIGF